MANRFQWIQRSRSLTTQTALLVRGPSRCCKRAMTTSTTATKPLRTWRSIRSHPAGLQPIRTMTTAIPENNAGIDWNRTHSCGELSTLHEGEEVTLCGWVHMMRDFGESLSFIALRDGKGLTQAVLSADTLRSQGQKLSMESVICIKGIVSCRPEKEINKNMQTGAIEIKVSELTVLNTAAALPFPLFSQTDKLANETLRQQYRYLDLRRDQLQHNLRTRSTLALLVRDILAHDHGFVEIETPTLFKRTPGGAAEFPVPTQKAGQFYTLVQSPQQFKQLLMVGGLDRYFQFARCYRDEGGRGDRQPEFTQIDLELSFTTRAEIENIIEGLVKAMWKRAVGVDLQTPFTRMTFETAMNLYGVDKPDTRFDMKLHNVTSHVDVNTSSGILREALVEGNAMIGIKVPQATGIFTKGISKKLQEYVKGLNHQGIIQTVVGKDAMWKSPIANQVSDAERVAITNQFKAEEGDVLLLAVGAQPRMLDLFGKLRLHCADLVEDSGVQLRDPSIFNFLWVDDFPLFEIDEETGGIASTHHVFTAPVPGDEGLLATDPLRVRGQHMDLVLNGVELGGGSIRNHNADMQSYIIEHVLKEDKQAFEHLIKALTYGAPPHGGLALGFDRLMMVLLGTENLRDVIAFPKSFAGKDLMGDSPCEIADDYLSKYHIEVKHTLPVEDPL
eukprot:m.54376 g.54376  ORF g.54376 m.54376 type:complete len:673 (-) comp21902_c0_seq2:492-2510(-)